MKSTRNLIYSLPHSIILKMPPSLNLLRSLPLASSSRLLSTSSPSTYIPPPPTPSHTKKISKNNPKRLPTVYGIPHSIPREDWPIEKETNTENHPLWRFFGTKKESLEVPDKREDTTSSF